MAKVSLGAAALCGLAIVTAALLTIRRPAEQSAVTPSATGHRGELSTDATASVESSHDQERDLADVENFSAQVTSIDKASSPTSESGGEKSPHELSIEELPPDALAHIQSLGYVPAELMARDSYRSYDLGTLKALARNGDGKAATMVATDWSVDREERLELAIIAARAGSPAALHLMATGEFQAPEFLPNGHKALEESYVWYLAATELLNGQVTQSNAQIERYASLLTETEIQVAQEKSKQLVAEIRKP